MPEVHLLGGPGFSLTVNLTDTEDLISYRVVVDAGVTVEYEVWRSSNRQPWRSGTVTGPVDDVFEAGGPVKAQSDIGHISMRVV